MLTFWKVSLKGRIFTLVKVPFVTVVVVVVITGGAVAMVVAVVAAAVAVAPGKGFGKNLKKILLIKRGGIFLGAFNAKKSTSGGNKGTP